MVIECSSCKSRFKLADDKIKESGTKVRCTKCREVFTVFPESAPQMAPPVITVPPLVPAEKEVVRDDFFSLADKVPVTPETPSPTVNVPASAEDDWGQEDGSSFFANDAGASDLDAINFDNLETPAFSVPTEKTSKFEFNDDTAFSFEDSSLELGVEQQYKISDQTGHQPLSAESDRDFEADFSSTPSPLTAPEDLSQSSTRAADGEFTFSEAENLADFSWGETDAAPSEPAALENSHENRIVPQDTAFDFSSFSFDETSEAVVSDETQSDDTVNLSTQSEATIEISRDTEPSTPPVLIRPILTEPPPTPTYAVVKDRESTSPPARPLRLRPRSRQIKKRSSRLLFKAILAVFLVLGLVYGILNRHQIQKEYKNLVSGFIENQVPAETNGRIGLTKLSGGYLLNSQEGELFVIRGEAINEFKGLRSSVLVKGTIYGENGAAIQNQSAYCGNSIKDDRLQKLGFKEIRDIMNNELGENLVNLNISPGKRVPFMIVFNKTPKNIKEFAVEVVDSKSGSK